LGIIFDAPVGTQESDEADILGLLIDDYEERRYPIEAPDPIEAIKIRMEDMNLKQADLIPVLGGKNRVSEILNRRSNQGVRTRPLANYSLLTFDFLLSTFSFLLSPSNGIIQLLG
jgi:HTH-type transcriptional regulator/antitoxin HigA